jgi:hypothetical protein
MQNNQTYFYRLKFKPDRLNRDSERVYPQEVFPLPCDNEMKFIKLILCKWLKVHWIREHHWVYADGSIESDPDNYCDLCGYWPGIDDPNDYEE